MSKFLYNWLLKQLLLVCCLLYMNVMQAQQLKLVLPVGHTNSVYTAQFSPDGRTIVTASSDGTAKIWDAFTGNVLAELIAFRNSSINTAQFSPDGNRIVTASNYGEVKVWDASTGNFSYNLNVPLISMWPQFSPDGKKIVTASTYGEVKVWNALTGNLVVDLIGHNGTLNSAQFSPDGKRIVTSCSDSTAKIWNASTGSLLFNLKGHTGELSSAQFSPDGNKIVTSCFDKTAKIWDALTGMLIVNLKRHTSKLLSAQFSPDGKRIVTTSSDKTAKIWDALTGKLIADLREISSDVFAQFSPDGRKIVTFTFDNTAKIWDALTGNLLAGLKEPTGAIGYAEFSPDGQKILTASFDNTAKIWNASTGTLLLNLKGHTVALSSARFSPDGKKIVTRSAFGTARTWDVLTCMPLANLPGHSVNVLSVQFSPDGKRIVTSCSDSTAKIWNASTGTLLLNLKGHNGELGSSQFSPDGNKILTASFDKTVKIWDALTGKLSVTLKAQINSINGSLTSPQFSPDGKKVVTCSRREANIWDVLTGNRLLTLKGHTDDLSSVQFSPDGKKIVSSSENSTGKIWNALTGNLLVNLKGKTGMFSSAQFSPDGNKVVTVQTILGGTQVWEVSTGKLLADLEGTIFFTSVSAQFSPDGKKIVTAFNNAAKIWDAATGILLADLHAHTAPLSFAQFSPDGKKILTTSEDNTAKIWDASSGKLLYSFVSLDSSDYFVLIPPGYYHCTPNAAKLLHYVDKDLKVITFEQLDVKYNRPDLVLEAIECPDTSLIQSYKKAWEKRITRLGFDTSLFTGGYHVPEAVIQNRDSVQYEQTSNTLSIKIKAKDDSVMLDRYNVWINEVPLFGVKGVTLKNRNTKHIDTAISVKLSQGTNRIEASVTSVGGLESYRAPLEVKYISPDSVKDNLYFIGIGIDHFNNSRYNLSWSIKDIRDLAYNFRKKYGLACIIDTLFDKDVSVEKVKALKQQLLKTTEDDKVIVAYSGHGLLSKDYDYFLSTFNVNFQQPQEDGLPYEMLEDLLDGIPARKKLMLIDACHSGEVDKEEVSKMVKAQAELDSTKKGVIVLIDTTNKKLGTKNSFELMQEVFVNVGRSTGATIISAAAGTQFALERGDLKNGVFSYSILELMKDKTTITVSELRKYVNKRVTELTHGMQVPTTRNENIELNWNVW